MQNPIRDKNGVLIALGSEVHAKAVHGTEGVEMLGTITSIDPTTPHSITVLSHACQVVERFKPNEVARINETY